MYIGNVFKTKMPYFHFFVFIKHESLDNYFYFRKVKAEPLSWIWLYSVLHANISVYVWCKSYKTFFLPCGSFTLAEFIAKIRVKMAVTATGTGLALVTSDSTIDI